MKWNESTAATDLEEDDIIESSVSGWHLNLTRDFNTEVQEYLEGK